LQKRCPSTVCAKNDHRTREWRRMLGTTKGQPPRHKAHVLWREGHAIALPPLRICPHRDNADDGCAFLRTLLRFRHPLADGLAIWRVTPTKSCPGLHQAILLWRKVARAFGVGRLGADIQGEMELHVQRDKQLVRGFPLNREGAMIDLEGRLLRL